MRQRMVHSILAQIENSGLHSAMLLTSTWHPTRRDLDGNARDDRVDSVLIVPSRTQQLIHSFRAVTRDQSGAHHLAEHPREQAACGQQPQRRQPDCNPDVARRHAFARHQFS